MIATNGRTRRLAAAIALVFALAVLGDAGGGPAEARYPECANYERTCHPV